MRSKFIPTLICTVLLLGTACTAACATKANATASAEDQPPQITAEIVKEKIEICRTGDEQQRNKAFGHLYANCECVLPILDEIIQSGAEQDRAWADKVKTYINRKERQELLERIRVLEQQKEKN